MTWTILLQGIIFVLFIIGLIYYIYYFRDSAKKKEGFDTDIADIAFCDNGANGASLACTRPDIPLIGPETSAETQVLDAYEANNIYDMPTFKQTSQTQYDTTIQYASNDFSQGLPWDIDNIIEDPNVALWGFVEPTCSRELFTMWDARNRFGSINNFDYDQSSKVFTYQIPIFNNMEVSGGAIPQYQAAEFITNFALGIVVEEICNELFFEPLEHSMHSLASKSEIPFFKSMSTSLRADEVGMSKYSEYLDKGYGVNEAKAAAYHDKKNAQAIMDGKPDNARYKHVEQKYKSTLDSKKLAEYEKLSPLKKQNKLFKSIAGKGQMMHPKMKVPFSNVISDLKSGLKSWGDSINKMFSKDAWTKFFNPGMTTKAGEAHMKEILADNKIIKRPATGATKAVSLEKSAAAPLTDAALKKASSAVGKEVAGKVAQKAATEVGSKLTAKIGGMAAEMGPLTLTGPVGWIIEAFMLVWMIVMLIILPAIFNEFVPPDGVCPTCCPFNLHDAIAKALGEFGYQIITMIPVIGDGISAFAPYVCSSTDGANTAWKIKYDEPLYYEDSTLSIFALNTKPQVPDTDPAYTDKRQFYEVVGYNFDAVNSGMSINMYLSNLTKAVNLNNVSKDHPPVWVDFADPVMLNKMAEYYYKTSRRLPYTNSDGTLSFEYISKIYGVITSSIYSCDIQCEITIDTIYPFTGVLQSRVIVPTDPLGNTYHDRRFYFHADRTDELYGHIIHGNVIKYFFKMPNSQAPFGQNLEKLPVRSSSVYSTGCNWDLLMRDNMLRYHVTGCTCINGTAPAAADAPSAGYAGDTIVSVSDPGADYFKPTINVNLQNSSLLPTDTSCSYARSTNTYSKVNSIPMSKSKHATAAQLQNVSIIYDGSLFAKIPSLRLTLAATAAGKLTFSELEVPNFTIPVQKQVSAMYDNDWQGASTNDAVSTPVIGNAVRIRDDNGRSFDASIKSFSQGPINPSLNYVGANLGLYNIRNIRGVFDTTGTDTMNNCIVLYASKWTQNTKIWEEDPPVPISDRQHTLSILQSMVTGTIAQAPGLGMGWQFAGGALVTGLDMAGVTNAIACSYADVQKQTGTFVVNGVILTNLITWDGSQCLAHRGPIIDYSPGFTPSYNKTSGLTLTQNDCINRYNIRVALKTYVSQNTNRIVKTIYHIRTIPKLNMCVYDIEQAGYNPTTMIETPIPDKIVSFGIIYTNLNETSTYVPTQQIDVSPPTIENTPAAAPAVNAVPLPMYMSGDRNLLFGTASCEEPLAKYSCANYRIRKRLFKQFNTNYGSNPAIYPQMVNTTPFGSCTITTAPYGLQNKTIINIPYTPSAGSRVGDAGIVRDQTLVFREQKSPGEYAYTFEGVVESVNVGATTLTISNIYMITPYIEVFALTDMIASPIKPLIVDLTKPTIQFTMYNSGWLEAGMSVNISLSNSLTKDALNEIAKFTANVTSYTNNLAIFKPTSNISAYGANVSVTSITIRLNEIGAGLLNALPNATTPIPIVCTNMTWMAGGINVNVRCIASNIIEDNTPVRIITYNANVTAGEDDIAFILNNAQNVADSAQWLQTAGITITIIDTTTRMTIYTGAITAMNANTITLNTNPPEYPTPSPFIIQSGSNSVGYMGTIAGNVLTNTFIAEYILTINDSWPRTFDISTLNVFSNEDPMLGTVCTYMADITTSTYNTTSNTIETEQRTPTTPINIVIAPTPYTDDNSMCMCDRVSDNLPSANWYPPIPRPGNVISLPIPIPPPNKSFSRGPECDTDYGDCSGIKIVSHLVDTYNNKHPYAKILKVIRAYTPQSGGAQVCEYQVEMSRKIPGTTRDHITKKETIRFNLVPNTTNQCQYDYQGDPEENSGVILNANTWDPFSGVPDSFQLSPIYVWPISIINRYRTMVNDAISMYQSMTPTWGSILKSTSLAAQDKMTKIFYEVYTNKTLGGCPDKNCRDNDTLLKICMQYNYDNYPTYFGTTEQYGFVQRSIIKVRRGGLGGNLTQCHIELIEQEDFYEDYTLPPVNTDDPNQVQFNTKFFLRQYQFDLSITSCIISPVAMTKQQITSNYMDISSNPFGIQSDLSIISPNYVPPIPSSADPNGFMMSEFYSAGFLRKVIAQYNGTLVHRNPNQYNKITNFINAFIISPTICEYHVKITRQIYSDDYGIWYPTPNIDSYIVVKSDRYTAGRNISGAITEYILMDIAFSLENDNYVPRRNGQIVSLPYIFYADLTNTTSRVVGFTGTASTGPSVKLPNTDTTSTGWTCV